ncbi:MAG: DMT family transporter, partial [Bacteroidales bacterium]|nr:DMT family transporter [Bacteroidales bacterium]
LPLTIAGPVNATRPVFVLLGAILFFGERLNVLQWAGVLVSLFSIFLLSRSGKKEGIDFAGNKWILVLFAAALMGAVSGLYDKYIMKMLPPLYVQSRFNIYQAILMGIIVWGMRRKRSSLNHDGKFKWKWSILLISLFISVADFAYFYALSLHGSMISVVSMIRRGSVLVSFTCGALLFKEKNIGSKALDLLLILAGMALLFLGSVI